MEANQNKRFRGRWLKGGLILKGLKLLIVYGLYASNSAHAVVAKSYLPDSSAPPSICFISFWDNFEDQFSSPKAGCSATLIRPNRVLTAAHCLDNFKTLQATIICDNGDKDFSVNGYDHDPQYVVATDGTGLNQHDVAIIGLDSNSSLPVMQLGATDAQVQAALANPTQCALWGFGRNGNSSDDNSWGTLRGAAINYLSPANIQSLFGWPTDSSDIYIGTSVYAAPGDSGGAIVCTAPGTAPLQIATTMMEGQITAPGAADGDRYSIQEAIPFNYDWINQEADLAKLPN